MEGQENTKGMNSNVAPNTVQNVAREYLQNTLDPEHAKEAGEYLFKSKCLYEMLKALEQLGVIIFLEISFVNVLGCDQVFFQIQTVATTPMPFAIGFKPMETVVQNDIRYVIGIPTLVIMMDMGLSREIPVHHEIDAEMLRDIINRLDRELRERQSQEAAGNELEKEPKMDLDP
jgi:hypothetical protein